MNKVQLIGRTARDIELRWTQNQTAVASFPLAVQRRKKEDGADFISCVAWGKTAEILQKYVSKGDKLGVAGRVQTRNYTNQQGQTIYVTEVVVEDFDFLESRRVEPQQQEQTIVDGQAFINVTGEDELPF